jgi:ABC-type transporter Mla subunit MlaD
MKFFKKLKRQREESFAAIKQSQELLDKLAETEPEVEELHNVALRQLAESKKQACRLRDADRRNHYSEGLTQSYREKLA